jgi:hypothetical protein
MNCVPANGRVKFTKGAEVYSVEANKKRYFVKQAINYITNKPAPEQKTIFLKSNVKNRSRLANITPADKILEMCLFIDFSQKKKEVLEYNENLREYRRLSHFFKLEDKSQNIKYKTTP